jgi:hypothetical protein
VTPPPYPPSVSPYLCDPPHQYPNTGAQLLAIIFPKKWTFLKKVLPVTKQLLKSRVYKKIFPEKIVFFSKGGYKKRSYVPRYSFLKVVFVKKFSSKIS